MTKPKQNKERKCNCICHDTGDRSDAYCRHCKSEEWIKNFLKPKLNKQSMTKLPKVIAHDSTYDIEQEIKEHINIVAESRKLIKEGKTTPIEKLLKVPKLRKQSKNCEYCQRPIGVAGKLYIAGSICQGHTLGVLAFVLWKLFKIKI